MQTFISISRLRLLLVAVVFLFGFQACSSSGGPSDAGPEDSSDGAAADDGMADPGPGDGDSSPGDAPWGGLTIDEAYTTDQIELVASEVNQGYRVEFYRNLAYTCGISGYQTFSIVYPENLSLAEERPLWIRMHGGGVGAFRPDGSYSPEGQIGMLDEEGAAGLAGQILETGLMTKVRTHSAGFRFMMPSLCDHDVYSGVGVPEPNNPNSPDENGQTRAADGLLATKAAIAFTRNRVATNKIFLQGTSAGSIGTFSVAYTLEREGIVLSGIVADSHVFSEAFRDIIEAGCTAYETDLIAEKIGPMSDPDHLPDRVVARGDISVPIMHVWSRGDPSCCGETPITFIDDQGHEQTMGSCDYHHERFRAAIAADPPGGSSVNLRLCVNGLSDNTPLACNMHSPTKVAYTEPDPPGDQDDNGRDYNQVIIDWVSERLQD
ncbi:MAG: hypothetical protein JRJ87_13535 [Deltaproteobacteria bacterium]|nr:hypothetical protein [Deltaproteobacteria bacterium]